MKLLVRIALAGAVLLLLIGAGIWWMMPANVVSGPGESATDRLYTDPYFEGRHEHALSSAEIIVPIVMDLVQPRSVLDVGCGRGEWLREFQNQGVERIWGLDGAYLDLQTLVIPKENFRAVDLNTDRQLDGEYDLAVCLEVAEHVQPDAAEPLIKRLTASAPVVLFSAAIPGQGGVGHVNEQWPAYWRAIFASHDFVMVDPIRNRIRSDQRVQWWYRQNILLYVDREALNTHPTLQSALVPHDVEGMEWVHSNVLNPYLAERQSRLYRLYRGLRKMLGR